MCDGRMSRAALKAVNEPPEMGVGVREAVEEVGKKRGECTVDRGV